MKQNRIVLFLAAVLAFTSLAGCSTTSTAESAQTAETTTLTGQVTAINDDIITLALGSIEQRNDEMGDPPTGEPPSGENPNGEASIDGERPEPPENASGTAIESGVPGQKNGRGGNITLSGEEEEIAVTAETTILIDNMGASAEGSLSDLTEGTILTVTMTGDTVTEIIVFASPTNLGNPQEQAPATDTAE